MDTNTIVGVLATIGILYLCRLVAHAGKGQGEPATPEELDRVYGKHRNKKQEGTNGQ